MTRATYIFISIFLGLFCLQGLAATQKPLKVVASFSVLGDLVKQVGGKKIALNLLVGPDSDAHVFQPSPADAGKLAQADLVFVNGLGFEGWIDRLVKSSGYRGNVAVTSVGINTLRSEDHDHAPHHDGEKEIDETDPHAWLDIKNTKIYIDNILQALSQLDPENKAYYAQNASHYQRKLSDLDQLIREKFAAIPVEKRKIVTSHEAFSYFGRAYGLTFIAPVGINTEAEPSAQSLAKIISQIRKENIQAVFLENISNTRLLEQLSRETGVKIGGTLYTDSLSKAGGPAANYLDLMQHNAQSIFSALSK